MKIKRGVILIAFWISSVWVDYAQQLPPEPRPPEKFRAMGGQPNDQTFHAIEEHPDDQIFHTMEGHPDHQTNQLMQGPAESRPPSKAQMPPEPRPPANENSKNTVINDVPSYAASTSLSASLTSRHSDAASLSGDSCTHETNRRNAAIASRLRSAAHLPL